MIMFLYKPSFNNNNKIWKILGVKLKNKSYQ